MYDSFSFVSANLRLMKNHWKNKGAPLGGMGGGGGDRLSWTDFLHFFAAYIKAAAYVRPRPIIRYSVVFPEKQKHKIERFTLSGRPLIGFAGNILIFI